MSRLLTLGRKQYSSLLINNARRPVNTIPLAGSNLRQVVGPTLYSPNVRLYSRSASPSLRLCMSLLLSRISLAPRTNTVGLGFRRSYGTNPGSFTTFGARAQMLAGVVQPGKALAKQTRLAWKNFYPSLMLSLSRSYVVIPGIYAIMASGSNVAHAQAAQAQGQGQGQFNVGRKSLYMRAQDGYALSIHLATSFFHGIILLFRALHLVFLFSPCIAMLPFAGSFGPEFRQFMFRLVHRTLEKAGPVFIKWGQWAAERPDIFPEDLRKELSKLQKTAPEHGFDITKETTEMAFGKLSDIFDVLEEKPEGSGSIAQVHRATLKPEFPGGGDLSKNSKKFRRLSKNSKRFRRLSKNSKRFRRPVGAVKVLHSGVGDKMERDIEIIKIAARLSKAFPGLEWLRLDETVQQFAVTMMSQVDLSREASNLSRFSYNFRRWKNVFFPKPLYPLVHPKVMVMSFEEGRPLSYYVDELEGEKQLKSSISDTGTHVLLQMLVEDNFIHADMHPGNIIVREVVKGRFFKRKQHELVFLDVGMTAELPKNHHTNLVGFFESVARRDGQTAAECALRLSKQQKCPNPQAFVKDLKELFEFWGTPEGDRVHPAQCLHELIERVRVHKVNIDGDVFHVINSTLVLQGWQRKLDSEYDVMRTLQKMLLKKDNWAKSPSDIMLESMAL